MYRILLQLICDPWLVAYKVINNGQQVLIKVSSGLIIHKIISNGALIITFSKDLVLQDGTAVESL